MTTIKKLASTKVKGSRALVSHAKKAAAKKVGLKAASGVVRRIPASMHAPTASVIELPRPLQAKMDTLADAGIAFLARFNAAR